MSSARDLGFCLRRGSRPKVPDSLSPRPPDKDEHIVNRTREKDGTPPYYSANLKIERAVVHDVTSEHKT